MKFKRCAYHLTQSVKIKNNLLALTCDRCHFGFVNPKTLAANFRQTHRTTFIIISHIIMMSTFKSIVTETNEFPASFVGFGSSQRDRDECRRRKREREGERERRKMEKQNISGQSTWNGKLIISTLINQISFVALIQFFSVNFHDSARLRLY